jgi:Glycoside-hydrolase family GH114
VRATVAVAGVAVLVLLTGCEDIARDSPRLPSAGAGFDYQLGGASEPAAGVDVLARDSTDDPAPGLYNICYVNGFQTQPGEGEHWLSDHPDLVLHDAAGAPFIDPGWPDEYLLDTSTGENRDQIASLLGQVLAGCATDGFDAVEIDNLDSWTRSADALSFDDNVELAAAYARTAHQLGLAIAQKNGAGDSAELRDRVGFDFVVSEECAHFDECSDYLEAYDGLVFDIEYPTDDDDFGGWEAACADPDRPASMILRDRDLTMPGDSEYVRQTC